MFFIEVWTEFGASVQGENQSWGGSLSYSNGVLLSTKNGIFLLSSLHRNQLQWGRAPFHSQTPAELKWAHLPQAEHGERREEICRGQLKRARERPTASHFFLRFLKMSVCLSLCNEVSRPVWLPHRLSLSSPCHCGSLPTLQLIFHCDTWKSALCTSEGPNQSRQMECVGYLRIVAEQI